MDPTGALLVPENELRERGVPVRKRPERANRLFNTGIDHSIRFQSTIQLANRLFNLLHSAVDPAGALLVPEDELRERGPTRLIGY